MTQSDSAASRQSKIDGYRSYASRKPTAAIDEAPLVALAAGVAAGALIAALLPVTRQERKLARPVGERVTTAARGAADAARRAQQGDERRLRPDGHLRGDLLYPRGEADELQGVAQAVVAADEDALSVERRAVPHPLLVPRQVPARLARFFTKEDHSYQVVRELREAVVFTSQSLLADAPFSRLDLISCRNLLIYLSAPLQKKLMSVFHYALREGGYRQARFRQGHHGAGSRGADRGIWLSGRYGVIPGASTIVLSTLASTRSIVS